MRSLSPRAALPGLVLLLVLSACDQDHQTEAPDAGELLDGEIEPTDDAEPGPEYGESPGPQAEAGALDDAASGMDADIVSDAGVEADGAEHGDRDAEKPGGEEGGTDAELNCAAYVQPTDCADGGALPLELRCTGLYSDFAARRVACGVEAYTPAYELWSDGAEKQRYLSLPSGGTIDVTHADAFQFPVGTRLWKEFRVQRGGSLQPAETRLLLKSELGWLYTTYVWSEDGQRALQENQGVLDWLGSGHRVPTRDQCRECHEGRADFALGFDLALLGSGARGLNLSELLARDLVRGRSAEQLLGHTPPGNELERAALGYLHVNCGVSCHNDSSLAGARDSGLFLRLESGAGGSVQVTPTIKSGVNKLPGIHAKLPAGGPYYAIRPGDPAHSLLLARMVTRGDETQMPRIGSQRMDSAGVELIARFIEQMSGERGYAEPAPLDGGMQGPLPDAGEHDAGQPDASAEPDAGTPDTSVPDAGQEPEPDAGVSCQTATPPPTQNLAYQTVVRSTSMETLTFAAQAPGSDDWYLVEMRGRILRLRNGALDAAPFLDLRGAIDLGAGFDQTTITYDERGLVGLAFAPDYAASGLFYIAITPSRGNALGLPLNHDLVVEYARPTSEGESPSLRRILLDVPSASGFLGNIHNANTVRFGPDGKLYVGMGDGGGVNCNDAELNASQKVESVFGKILRLDPALPPPHAAPDNPFAGLGDARVLHYGLRNPFRFSFDRATGDLFIGDVGQNRYEEINHAPRDGRGLNFGWATFEALASCGQPRPLRPGSTATPPIFVADRTGTGLFSDYRAIT
ncbi:MAG TPA: PQQ-dependent sugar dehydrogenase, partial [Polyangiales bacterium]